MIVMQNIHQDKYLVEVNLSAHFVLKSISMFHCSLHQKVAMM